MYCNRSVIIVPLVRIWLTCVSPSRLSYPLHLASSAADATSAQAIILYCNIIIVLVGNMQDGRKGVQRVLCVSSICAIAYSSAQVC